LAFLASFRSQKFVPSLPQMWTNLAIRTRECWLTLQVPAPIVGATEGSAADGGGAQKAAGFTPMARRRATNASGKTLSAPARAPRVKAKGGPAGGTLADRLAAVERERDSLKDELERSKSRLRLLEDTQSQVRNRIAWALDSLHSILQGKG
jgi:hypothetical protein